LHVFWVRQYIVQFPVGQLTAPVHEPPTLQLMVQLVAIAQSMPLVHAVAD
jgi:hypothetical protein